MVSDKAIRGTVSWIHHDRIVFSQTKLIELTGHIISRGKGSLGRLVLDELNSPEQTTSPDVANVGVPSNGVAKSGLEESAHDADIGQEGVFLDDLLHCSHRGTAHGMGLVRVPVHESPAK